jgi:hypothetical protein
MICLEEFNQISPIKKTKNSKNKIIEEKKDLLSIESLIEDENSYENISDLD